MKYVNILSENRDSICYITINRPKQLNSLNAETIKELNHSIICADNNDLVRCIILTGAEDKAFIAGADIKEFASLDIEEGESLSRKGQELLFDLLESIGTPSIAAINGYALGGGLELAMSCHIRIASTNAKMGLPEVSLGVIPGYGGTQRLASLVGKGKAMEMVISADILSAEDALKWGLVNYIVSQDELIGVSEKIAEKIKNNSPMAIAKAIKSVNAGFIDGINGFTVEQKEFGSCFKTPEFIEGTTAFMEKRKAKF
tara:strand:+ start:24 stop:797 length:774 start_codon:yes stop_codon:yes gene_type:complete